MNTKLFLFFATAGLGLFAGCVTAPGPFPPLDTTQPFAWAGSFGTTSTGLPLIGRVPRHPNVWAILGFGGTGITYSRIAADIIAGGIAGRPDPDAELYAFA